MAQGRGGCLLSRGPCAGHPGDGGRGAWWQPAWGEAVDGWRGRGRISRRRVPGLSSAVLREPALRPCSSSTGTIRSRSVPHWGQGARTRRVGGVLLEPCSLAVRSATPACHLFPESAPASLDSPRRPTVVVLHVSSGWPPSQYSCLTMVWGRPRVTVCRFPRQGQSPSP